ncbi:MAG: helical backbone metal receptor [Anaerolineales bacterium]
MTSGNGHAELMHFSHAPQRVVSLVPSITDSLIQLGAGDALVGITEYCPLPVAVAKPPTIVGGTKTVDVDRVAELKPDLVIANQEENPREVVGAMEEAGLQVWVTFPKSTYDALRILHTLAQLFRLPAAPMRIETLERTLDWTARSTPEDRLRVFCPIWYEAGSDLGPWWMTFNGETYAGDLLRICGGDNIFAKRERRYPLAADLGSVEQEPPGERDTRYPRMRIDEIAAADPQVILLPSEPFAFDEGHHELVSELLADTEAVRRGRIHRIDGSLISWHGTMMARALSELPAHLQLVDDDRS